MTLKDTKQADLLKKAKRPKYGNRKTTVDGIVFASAKEAERYKILKAMEAQKLIYYLELQPRFPIEINGILICTYVADFHYYEGEEFIVEDVKGMRTREYKLKKKLVKAVYGIEIREV